MTEENVMRETVEQWKEAHKEPARDLDFEMLCSVLKKTNDISAVKIARNPLDAERNWIHETVARNIGKVDVDDEGRLTLGVRHDNEEMSVDKLLDRIGRLKKKIAGGSSSVMLAVGEKDPIRLTDIYSHALMRDNWAGLPFDVVLAYYEED